MKAILDAMLKGQEAVMGGWRTDDPQTEPDPGECEECGEPNAIWLCGPYSTGLFLCKPHLEDYLTKGRGKR